MHTTAPSRPVPSFRAVRTLAVSACVLATLGAGIASAQVGAAWSEYQGGPAKTGVADDGPEPGYALAWRSAFEPAGPGQRFGLSAPVVAGEVAVAVGPEQVIGVELATGEPAFSVDRELGPSVPAAVAATGERTLVVYTEGWGEGPPESDLEGQESPSPSTDVENDDGPSAHLAAFDVETQRPAWPAVPLQGVSRTGVTADGGTAFVGANDGTVTAVDLAEGDVVWQEPLDAVLVTSIAVADGTVLVGLQGDRDRQPAIVALDAADGEERWRHEPSAASTVVSAISAADGSAFAVFTGLSETSVVAVDLDDGAERWSTRVRAAFDVIAPPVVGGGAVYVTDLIGHTRALDASDGRLRWDFALNAPTFRGVPILIGEHLLVPTIEGELAAIDATTGELVWRLPADGSSMRSLASTADTVVAVRGGARSGIDAFEHDPEAELVREASPTTLDAGRMAGAMAIAGVGVVAVVLLIGRWLSPRMGPAFPDDDEPDPGAGEAEPVRDPWEEEGGSS